MTRTRVEPIFVDRKTAAARIMISVDTFDTWLRAGFIPRPQIDRGQIVRWHWPSLEGKLAGLNQEPTQPDPLMEGVARVFGKRDKAGRSDQAPPPADDYAEMARRYAAAQEQWKADLPKSPLSKRERYCLSQFEGVKAGEQVGFKDIRGSA